jgi:hypothetical protein
VLVGSGPDPVKVIVFEVAAAVIVTALPVNADAGGATGGVPELLFA